MNQIHGASSSIQWLIEQLEHVSDTFTAWFQEFEVDLYTEDWRSKDEFHLHGFSRPDREPDGVWDSRESEDYPTGTTRISFWREGEEVLAFSEIEDPVMSLDHYHWYRIPLNTIVTRMSSEGIDPVLVKKKGA